MSRTVRTIVFCAAAAVILGSALLLQYRSAPAQAEAYELVSQPFYPDFNDPLTVTSFEIVDFDEDELKIRDFAVERNEMGRWVIPSHHGYPAEAKERLERAASSVIGVVREASQSRRKDDWSRLGVLSPTEFDDENLEGYGQKITFKDEDGDVLLDLIVGKPVPDQSGYFYVRRSDETATYIAKLNLDLSAKFQDWIDPDLLGINSAFDLVSIGVNKYSLNEQRRTIVPGDVLQLTRDKTTDPWVLTGIEEETEELNTGPISAFGNKVADLKIVGVRPKPTGVNPDLTLTPELLLNQQVLEIDMSRRGFLIAATEENEAPRLFSNEGEVSVGTKEGVEFTLYLGEIVSGSDRDIEVGAASETKGDDESTDEAAETSDEDDPEKGPRRYVLVTAEFNEALLGPKPEEPVAPVMPEELKESSDAGTDSDPESQPDSPKNESDADSSAKDPDAATTPDEPGSEPPSDESPSNSETPEADSGTSEPSEEPPAETPDETPDPTTEEPTTEGDESSCMDEETTAAEETPPDESQEEPAGEQPETTEESGTAAETSDEAPQESDPAGESAESTPPDENAAGDKGDEPESPQIDPKMLMQAAYDEQLRQYEAAKRQHGADLAEYNRKAEEGKEKAKELSDRFAAWYYVITADSFEELNLTREDVVKSKVAAKDDNEGDAP